MTGFLLLVCLLFSVISVTAQTPTTCPTVRVLETDLVHFLVKCNLGKVEITQAQYNALKASHAGNPAQFCTDGTVNASAMAELRWNTTTGFPEPCDVFSLRSLEPVNGANPIRVVFSDYFEVEIDTTVNVPQWSGAALICITPPIPDFTIGTCPP